MSKDTKVKPFHVVTHTARARQEANDTLDQITKDFEANLHGINTALVRAFTAGLEYARKITE